MPTGYNADGSKKVRPANSGRKKKDTKQIAPQITLEAAAVLKGLKKKKLNLNVFISEAIVFLAIHRGHQPGKIQLRPATVASSGQVDLVDLIEEVKQEASQEVELEASAPESDLEPDPEPIITSELSKPSYLEERKLSTYTALLESAFLPGHQASLEESVLYKIARKRRRGQTDAQEVLAYCVSAGLCTSQDGTVTLTSR